MVVTLDVTYKSYTLEYLQLLIGNLRKVLNILPSAMFKLCHIAPGSLKLTFQLHRSMIEDIFPLTSEQEAELAKLGVDNLTLFGIYYQFNRQSQVRIVIYFTIIPYNCACCSCLSLRLGLPMSTQWDGCPLGLGLVNALEGMQTYNVYILKIMQEFILRKTSSSYIVLILIVHMIQGRQYSVLNVQVTSISVPQSQRWSLPKTDSRPSSFDASITGDELDSTVQLPNFRSLVAWHVACMILYIAQG